MSGLGRFIRRTGALISVMSAVALVATPPAWPKGDTITARAGAPFSRVLGSSRACAPTRAPTVNWGDGTSWRGTYDRSNGTTRGRNTYAFGGTFTGTVTITSDNCRPNPATNTLTAGVAKFTQCPPVDKDQGCQFLITVSNGSETVVRDPDEGPYEGSDDALIGVQNDSSSPINALPLSVPNSVLFGFDGDGICDVAAPLPSGCTPIGSPAGTRCTAGEACAFPPAPGQPGPDPDAYSGSTQNGYEGPDSYFTNISADTSSGVVNFSPAIPPGGSTYFGLEEPPLGTTIGVGGTAPLSPGTSAPTVTATDATFSALVNPNGSPTTVQFQYGLDAKYDKLGASGPTYTNSTPLQSLPGDFANHLVTASVSGLVPNALYHVRLVTSNGSGTTFGPDMTFMTKRGPVPGSPTLGKTFNISLVSGLVQVKIHGVFIPLTELTQIPRNTVIDALQGTVKVVTAVPAGHRARDAAADGKKRRKGKTKTQSGTFGGAVFKISQAGSGLVTLSIVEGAFQGAPSYAECQTHTAGGPLATAASSRTLQLLRASARGRFSTRGRYSAATIRGTKWTIADRCDGTLTHDITDSVAVTDFVRHTTIILRAGQRYLAKAPTRRR